MDARDHARNAARNTTPPAAAALPVDALSHARENLRTLLDDLAAILFQIVVALSEAGRADYAAAGSALEQAAFEGGPSDGRGARALRPLLAAPLAPCGLPECVAWGAFLGLMSYLPRGIVAGRVDALGRAGVFRLTYAEASMIDFRALNAYMSGSGAQVVFTAFSAIRPDREPAGLGVDQGPCRTAAARLEIPCRPAGRPAAQETTTDDALASSATASATASATGETPEPVTAETLRIVALGLCHYHLAACRTATAKVARAATAAALYESVFVAFDVAEFLRWPAPAEARDVAMAALERSGALADPEE